MLLCGYWLLGCGLVGLVVTPWCLACFVLRDGYGVKLRCCLFGLVTGCVVGIVWLGLFLV